MNVRVQKYFIFASTLLLLSTFFVGCLGGTADSYSQSVTDNTLPLGIDPKNPRVEIGRTRRFNGTGGYIGSVGYRYSLTGLGGQLAPGSIDALTGIYTAPVALDANNTVAFVVVTDARGAMASTTLITVSPMQVTPTSQTITVGKKANFDVIGGQAPITWSVVDPTRGTITSTGLFSALFSAGSTAVVATDASGNTAQAVVVVRAMPTLTPSGIRVPYGWRLQMVPLEGSPPFTYSLDNFGTTGGGSIDANGLLIAPSAAPGTMTVTVKDYYDYTSTATLEVIAPNSVVSGAEFNCALLSDTKGIKCWGNSSVQQTGYPASFVQAIGGNNNLGDGPSELGSRVPVLYLNSGTFLSSLQIAAGQLFMCALDSGYNVRCWGKNTSGELGNTSVPVGSSIADASNASNGAQPVLIDNNGGLRLFSTVIGAGLAHVCAVDKNALTNLYCWGNNSTSQLGFTGANQSFPASANKIIFPTNILDVKAGIGHTCVLLASGVPTGNKKQIRCWGNNSSGQLGNGLTSTTGIPQIVTFAASEPAQLAVGGNHTCAFLVDGSAQCWGDNTSGQVARGLASSYYSAPSSTPINLGTDIIIKIVAGYNKTCFILLGGKLKCVGDNTAGSLGIGSDPTVLPFVGTAPADMGNNLLGVAVGSGFYVTDAAIGDGHVCALLDDNRVKCWGLGASGELGTGAASSKGAAGSDMGDALQAVGIF